MKKLLLLAWACLFCTHLPDAGAKEQFQLKESISLAHEHMLVVFAEGRLLRYRVDITFVGMKPNEFLREVLKPYFEFLDKDGDRMLDEKEIANAPTKAAMQQLMKTGNIYQPENLKLTSSDFDQDQDSLVNLDEFTYFYSQQPGILFGLRPMVSPNLYGQQITAALFGMLDTNKDDILQRAELESFGKNFARLDTNDDECITINEIMPTQQYGRMAVPMNGGMMRPNTQSGTLMFFSKNAVPSNMSQLFMNEYDKDNSGTLTNDEIPFERTFMKRVDIDRDGTVSPTECNLLWAMRTDDIVRFEIDLKNGTAKVGLVKPEGQLTISPTRWKSVSDTQLNAKIRNYNIHMQCQLTIQNRPPVLQGNNFSYLFNTKKTIEKADLKNPQYRLVAPLFDALDRNNDDVVTKKEVELYGKAKSALMGKDFTIGFGSTDPGMFGVVDENGDGIISLREARSLANRLLPNSFTDGYVRSSQDIQGMVTLVRGTVNPTFGQSSNPGAITLPIPTHGPVWFRKFDRNGDGDISPREFPGDPELFTKLDTNGDGLISRQEAEAAR
ncbi:MAG: EF-hand domain-containing protein [Zavarzinella sp.]